MEGELVSGSPDQPVFFIGTSGWIYDHWKGIFYPDNLPKSRWFEYYTSRFSAVEINATFYRTFKDTTFEKWRQRAPQGFGYVLKAPRIITHRRYLLDVEEVIKAFCRSSALLGDKLEMILLQVAPATPFDLERLQNAIKAFPEPEKLAVEFRHARWYVPETLELLRDCNATFCNVDSPRQKLTDILTTKRAYVRLHGRRRWYSDNYSDEELQEIAGLLWAMVSRGAQRVCVFFNNDFHGYAPANALTLLKIIEKNRTPSRTDPNL